MTEWRPSASLANLTERAKLLKQLRAFLSGRGMLEVETPLLSRGTVPDPGIAVFEIPTDDGGADPRYLQSSPEFAMKRLLAAGAGDIFQIGKAFRHGEIGRHHNPEFTLLEWYRVGWDHATLMREVAALVSEVLGTQGWQVWPYRALFGEVLAIDPLEAGDGHDAPPSWLRAAREHMGAVPQGLDRDAVLDLLMSHCVEPAIRDWGVVFVTDFPPAQAALAQTQQIDNQTVAARFECYVHGQELANGYWEQTDAAALEDQLNAENSRRQMRGLTPRPIDQRLLSAQRHGLPDCAGVALGVDRLLALKLGVENLAEVISFYWPIA